MLALIAAIVLAAPVLADLPAAYPGSIEMWGLNEPDGTVLITGEPGYIGTNYSDSSDNYNYVNVFDGDISTYYAPLTDDFGSGNIVYLKADTTYSVKEIRYLCREDKPERTLGYHFVGSNDGENWTDLYIEAAETEYDYICITSDKLLTDEAFLYFGVYQAQEDVYLNIAEMEFWGAQADTAAEEPAVEEAVEEVAQEPAVAEIVEEPVVEEVVETPAAMTAPATFDAFVVMAAAASVSGLAAFAAFKKRK